MIAKIIIRRKFLKGNEKQVLALLNRMRSLAMNQPAYISGETLIKLDQPHHLTVICTWQSMQAWQKWKHDRERLKLENMLAVFQEEPTEYEEYYLGSSMRP